MKFKETLEKLQNKVEINQFLEYLKEIETDAMGCHFDYSIINMKDINDIISDNVNINIQINNNYYQKFYNPIIYWVFDGDSVNIYDWYNLRINIINECWFDENQKKEIIERFSSIKINDILKPFEEQLQNFMREKEGLNHCPDNLEKGCFFFMYGDDYILVEPDRSYWYEEDDGTIVYRINEID